MASFGNLNITQENRFPQNFSSISACDTFYESACHVGKRANNIIVKYNFFHDTISQYCDRLSRQSCWVIQVATAFSQRLEVEVVTLCHVMSHHGIIEVYVQLPTFRGEVPQLSKIWFFFSIHMVAYSRRIIPTKRKDCRHFRGSRTNVEMSWPRGKIPARWNQEFLWHKVYSYLTFLRLSKTQPLNETSTDVQKPTRQITTANQMGCQPCA